MATNPNQNSPVPARTAHQDTAAAGNGKKQKQQIIVVVLLVGLLGVVMTQGKKADDQSGNQLAAHSGTSAPLNTSPASADESLNTLLRDDHLEVRSSDEIAATNLFVGTVRHQELDASPPRVTAVYKTRRSAAAIVGKRIVQPGTTLSDGQRVLNVDRGGIRVEQ